MLFVMAMSISGYPYTKFLTLVLVPFILFKFATNPKIDRFSIIFIYLTILNICILSIHSDGTNRTMFGLMNLLLLYMAYLKYKSLKFFNAQVIVVALFLTAIIYFSDSSGQNKNTLIIPAMVIILITYHLILNNKQKFLPLLFSLLPMKYIATSFSRQGVLFLTMVISGLITKQKNWLLKFLFFTLAFLFSFWLLESNYFWRFSKLVSIDLIQSTARYDAFTSAFTNGNFNWYGSSLSGEQINSISSLDAIYFDSTFALLSYACGIFGIAWLIIFITIIYRNVDIPVFFALLILLFFNEFYEFEQLIMFAFLLGTKTLTKLQQ